MIIYQRNKQELKQCIVSLGIRMVLGCPKIDHIITILVSRKNVGNQELRNKFKWAGKGHKNLLGVFPYFHAFLVLFLFYFFFFKRWIFGIVNFNLILMNFLEVIEKWTHILQVNGAKKIHWLKKFPFLSKNRREDK